MNLLNFFRRFPDEASCRKDFKKRRIQQGVVCKKCSGTEHYWLSSKESFQCKGCKFRTSLRSGTVMESSNLPFYYWYVSMHLLTSTKKSFSAKELQRQLGHKRYEPIWAMLHKLRTVMGKRDAQYSLGDSVEIDEGFFSNIDAQTSPKTPILIATESLKPQKQTKKKVPRSVRYIKMRVLKDTKKDSLHGTIKSVLASGTTVYTDGLLSYKYLKDEIPQVDKHERYSYIELPDLSTTLPWVHLVISNFRRLLTGIYHGVKSKYFQNYCDEFCYKFNRRNHGERLFERLLVATVNHTSKLV